jgi:hypothetical protein
MRPLRHQLQPQTRHAFFEIATTPNSTALLGRLVIERRALNGVLPKMIQT